MGLQPESKTWRILNATQGALVQAMPAIEAEGLQGQVGMQVREAGMYLAAALATLEMRRELAPRYPTVLMPAFTLQECDALVAVLAGAVSRIPPEAGELVEQLTELRDAFAAASVATRVRHGLPVD